MKEFFNYSILELGDFDLRISIILKLSVLIILVAILLFLLKKTIYRARRIELSRKYSIFRLAKYFILVLSIVIGLQILTFDLTVLLAGSAALLVGFGLGIQSLFSDFVSGIILLVDASVKVDDIIEVNGLVCKVQEINLRTTTVLTRDDKYIILPNTVLTKNPLINWTHSDIASRFDVTVGVDYTSDVNLVMKIIKEVAENQEFVLKNPSPFVRFTEYAESSLNFAVFFWVEEVFRVENIKSDIRVRIFEDFASNNVIIPFPQRVMHIKKQSNG